MLSVLLGVLAALMLVTNPFRGPSIAILIVVAGIAAIVLGWIARRWSRRAQRRMSPMAVAGVWLGAVALVLGVIPTLLILVLAEPLGPTPEEAAIALAEEDEDLGRVAALAGARLVALNASDARADVSHGTAVYPPQLAVSTDQDLLLTLDGDVLAKLPPYTRVTYETRADGEHFKLSLDGPAGGSATISDRRAAPPEG
ncbi:hypothetical protein [Agromyces arachidis]|uniref:hypothetical protein n=1 Tax=Agromyces arachidis TaxID=766966 RepID=UPI004056CE31